MSAVQAINIPADQVGALFPFHFVTDRSLNLVQLGQGLGRLLPGARPRSRLSEHLRLLSPRVDLETLDPKEHRRSVFIFVDPAGALRLKGQVFPVPCGGQHCLFFAVSPVVENMQSIRELGLTLSDFAVHDSATDLLLLLQAQGTTLRELQALSDSYRKEIHARRHAEEEMRAAVERAEAANLAKANFLAVMSHEMRTPLNAVLGMLSLLEDVELDAEMRGFLLTAQAAGAGLLNLIGDVLDFSKMDAGKIDLEILPFSIGELLDGVAAVLEPMAVRKGVAFVISTREHDAVAYLGDASRLRQVLLNLATNALKFTDTGSVELGLEVTGTAGSARRLKFWISDTGTGIPRSRHADLFKEFETLDPSYSRRHGGTGLGLAISRRLVELMDGRIGFESEEGRGSRFWFEVELEVCELDIAGAQGDRGAPASSPGPGGRLLLVEDVPANRQLAVELLRRAGYRVDAAVDGREAVTAATRVSYDAVLMDISMPGMDGLEATRRIRALPGPRAAVPIIAMTAHAMKGDREAFLAAGMDDYLHKPIDRQRLLEKVAAHVSGTVTVRRPARGVTTAEVQLPMGGLADGPGETVDATTLHQLAQDTSPASVPGLVALFVDDARLRVQRIAQALGQGDLSSVEDEAHALGSSALSYGLPQLHDLARRCEMALREGEHVEGTERGRELVRAAAAALAALEAHVAGLEVEQAG